MPPFPLYAGIHCMYVHVHVCIVLMWIVWHHNFVELYHIRMSSFQILTRHIPSSSLRPSLTSLLTRPNLHSSPLPWQHVAVSALSLLTSPSVVAATPPEQIDDIVITTLPLLLVFRRGNGLAGRVADVLSGSDVGSEHPLLGGLAELVGDEGELS